MPETTRCPVSSAVERWSVWSSRQSRSSASSSLSLSFESFGSTTMEITGSGKAMPPKWSTRWGAQSVSPMPHPLRPAMPTMSPGPASSICSVDFA